MKIAITAAGPTLDANLDPRFGRCPYFLIVDTDTMQCEALENPNVALGQGAGVHSAQLLAGRKVQSVLTGNCGPNAHETLSAAGIKLVLGCSGVVRDAVERFTAGQLTSADAPNVASHSGLADLPSPSVGGPVTSQPAPMLGTGMGMGRGRGRGGRGMGREMGRGGGGGLGRKQSGGRPGRERGGGRGNA
ncbi:MAG: NifB/NifX family molybdenum-iron cluster-binding protein [Phycisphaerae bacterium]|jgi:predicted Fe-Mo cluster-binding NifX family protein